MKTTILLFSFRPTYKFIRNWFVNLLVVCNCLLPASVFSQCTNYTVNWDYLDFLHNSAGSWYSFINPSTGQPFVTNTMKQSQNYALGPTNVLNISTSIPVAGSGVFYGDLTNHLGEIVGYTGADVSFTPTAGGQTIIFTFLNEVTNASFTLYGVDRLQVISVAATNTGGTAQTVTATTYGSSILTISGTPGKTITASNTTSASPSNTGSATFSVAAAVKTITLTVSTPGSIPGFWLSDITACSPDPDFPSNYYYPYTEPYT
ncbi:MAG TPA: hypothetical protein VFH08_04725, partial [Chitinophagaceae bacterium]|nr:hypothetical protein [Chitinophagaceae bacterium]